MREADSIYTHTSPSITIPPLQGLIGGPSVTAVRDDCPSFWMDPGEPSQEDRTTDPIWLDQSVTRVWQT